MSYDETAVAPVLAIGARVREHRLARGWSMRELARRASVSQPFVSKLEGGQLLPSLPTLYGLAAAFDLPASSLLPAVSVPDEIGDPAVHLPLSDDVESAAVRLLAGGDGSLLQVFEFRLAAGEGDRSYFRHGGEEVVYVVEGTLVSQREGEPDRVLARGESLRIDPSAPHRWRAGGEYTAFVLTCAEHSPRDARRN